ncbi:hypothetical protein DFO45_3384 [Azorhizobium sp. AG788]|uniref:hypothetical protein n=1 Tax=Azorhizobium sp. AG788 TaxID=2183897 RepID=UPI00105CB32A|nr:hypothetical protein [Azorhizobium sp. AG788]TDT92626.1 hypothetical protein DFO45_3384 [Azorhizobium sp. AG788]
MTRATLQTSKPALLTGALLIGLWLSGPVPGLSGQAFAAETGKTDASGCSAGSASHAATPPSQGPSSGTAAGNVGTTGWTNGMGGTHIGTSNHASTPGSPQAQPETVTGANPGSPDQPNKPC